MKSGRREYIWDKTPKGFIDVFKEMIQEDTYRGLPCKITFMCHPHLFYNKLVSFFAEHEANVNKGQYRYYRSEFTSNYYFRCLGLKIDCQLSPKFDYSKLILTYIGNEYTAILK